MRMKLPRCPFTPLLPETSAPSSQISRLDYLEPTFWRGSKWNESGGKCSPPRHFPHHERKHLINVFDLEVKALGRSILRGFCTIRIRFTILFSFSTRCFVLLTLKWGNLVVFAVKLHFRIKSRALQSTLVRWRVPNRFTWTTFNLREDESAFCPATCFYRGVVFVGGERALLDCKNAFSRMNY